MENAKTLKKIQTPAALAKIVADIKKKGKKVVLCHGVFDIVHLGHIRHFNQAKEQGDILVVSLTQDKHVKRGPGRPFFTDRLRAETLASLTVTDYVTVVDAPTATDFIRKMRPDIYAKGPDYKVKDKDVTGKILEEEEAVKSVGGRLFFTDDITFSSSKLINDYLDVYPLRTVKYLKAMAKRYSLDYIIESIEGLKKLKVLVIGDAIIDEYHYCLPMGKSSKEHLVANRYDSKEMFAGGSLATANNAASICGQVDLVTILGAKKSYRSFIENHLGPNVEPTFFSRPDTGTIVKRRYVSKAQNRKLFEICFIEDTDIARREEKKVMDHLNGVIRNYDLVIVSDYGHGFLTERIRKLICAKSKYLALNVQTNSANIGFNLVTKYPRAHCVCVDELELRYAIHDRFSDLRTHAKKVYEQLGCEHVIATRGSSGSLCYSQKNGFHETPAFASRVVDAIGAGDAFFAFIAPCFAASLPQEVVSLIGNAAGSLAVQIVCNREPVRSVDLIKFITRLLK